MATPAGEPIEPNSARLLANGTGRTTRIGRSSSAAVSEHAANGPEARADQGADRQRGRAGRSLAHARGRLPRGDVLPQAWRPEPESWRRPSRVPAGADVRAPNGEKHWQAPPPAGWRTSIAAGRWPNWITDTDAGAGHLLGAGDRQSALAAPLGPGHRRARPAILARRANGPRTRSCSTIWPSELIASGWRLKDLHKLIMTSAVYMQVDRVRRGPARASTPTTPARGGTRAAGWRPKSIRDAMLAVSGQLDERCIGPGTLDESSPPQHLLHRQAEPTHPDHDALRLRPTRLQGLGQRARTVVAPQALAMLNNPQVHLRARERLPSSCWLGGPSRRWRQRSIEAYTRAFARPADEAEDWPTH